MEIAFEIHDPTFLEKINNLNDYFWDNNSGLDLVHYAVSTSFKQKYPIIGIQEMRFYRKFRKCRPDYCANAKATSFRGFMLMPLFER